MDLGRWTLSLAPILLLLVLLVGLRWGATEAGPLSVAIAAVAALAAFETPWRTLVVAGGKGVWDAVPILFVIFAAAGGLFLSNLTRNQIVAGLLTYAVLLMLLLVAWVGEGAGPIARGVVSALSVFQHYEDFSKGVIDTQHVIYYLSVIAFGLFLTARSVDADRWRG